MWSLIVDRARPGWENMAVDAALLDRTVATGEAFLRCYQWEPHCLSFGRHEPALRSYDVARIRAEGFSCVRRPTGGRAVWHARELTYAVSAPISAFGGMREAYAAIHGILAAVIEALGGRAHLAPRSSLTPGLTSGPCFAAPVGGEVLVQGRKVVGSAQLRAGDAFLQHGSLLLEDDQSLVRDLAGLPSGDRPEAALGCLLGRRVTFEEAADTLATAILPLVDGLVRLERLPEFLESGAARHAGHFQSDAWTWQR
jgi:lipoate-protein ligase A